MNEDPIMRYIDVLKDRIQHLEDSLKRHEKIVVNQDKIIHSYKKITGLVVSIDNGDDNEDSICS